MGLPGFIPQELLSNKKVLFQNVYCSLQESSGVHTVGRALQMP